MNIETYLKEEEKLPIAGVGILKIKKEKTDIKCLNCSCGFPTILVSRTAYDNEIELGRVCDAAYCIGCNKVKYLGDKK